MTWTYEQATGKLLDPDGNLVATGYAGGNEGLNPEGINNPNMEEKHNIGPLPVGKYTLSQPILQSHLGPFAIPLVPDEGNEMFGRGGFYMHGDKIGVSHAASEGCIIMSHPIRDMVWSSDDHEIEVVRG